MGEGSVLRQGSVAVVTDSTAYLPPGLAAENLVGIVPLHVTINGRRGGESVDVDRAAVAAALRERRPDVTTSRPSPAEFAEAYRHALAAGARAVVSIHLSSALSGTWAGAVHAASGFPAGAVRVVDSRTTAMGLGFAVLAAAERAACGGDPAEVEAAATAVVDRTTTLFYVATLEHLRRGGRIGPAAALVGTALSVKPILQMVDGEVVLKEKVRTAGRGLARLEQLAVAAASDSEVDVAVHHLAVPERAEILRDRLAIALPRHRRLVMSELGAVVGAHVGPGALGVVVSRLR
jgi:DegV family protein with EDD domain